MGFVTTSTVVPQYYKSWREAYQASDKQGEEEYNCFLEVLYVYLCVWYTCMCTCVSLSVRIWEPEVYGMCLLPLFLSTLYLE